MYLDIFIAIIVTEAISELLVNSDIFVPVRKWFFNRRKKKFFDFIHNILDCTYCTSVWVALPVSLCLINIGIYNPALDWFFIWLFIHRLSSILSTVMERVKGLV